MSEREEKLEAGIKALEDDLRYQAKCWWISVIAWFALGAFNWVHYAMEHLE
jgi:hypothetical protein